MSERLVRVAMILADEREVLRRHSDPNPFFGTAPTALLNGLADTPGCEVHLICCVQRSVQAPAKIADNIHFHSLVVPRAGWLRSGYVGCIVATRRKLRGLRPDVVHGQGTERHYALCAAFSGFPNVITIHGNMRRLAKISRPRPFTFDWCTARLEAFALPRVGGVICPTHHTRAQVQPSARRTWVVPNAVDASFFKVENQPDGQTILCVGTIYLIKNQITLIRALDPLAANRPLRLVFLGRAPPNDSYAAEFRALVAQRPWCSYLGFADQEALKAHLKTATLLALPSLEENCPMVVLEAMAAGVPVVAAPTGGIPELVDDTVTGLLCAPTNLEAIRHAVDTILNQPLLRQKLAEEARSKARRRFLPGVIAQRHLEIYRQMVNNSASA